jgi:hypothetical protein
MVDAARLCWGVGPLPVGAAPTQTATHQCGQTMNNVNITPFLSNTFVFAECGTVSLWQVSHGQHAAAPISPLFSLPSIADVVMSRGKGNP